MRPVSLALVLSLAAAARTGRAGTAYGGPGTITVPAAIASPPVFPRDADRRDPRTIL